VQCKGGHARVRADSLRHGSGKEVVVQLEEFHVGKDANTVDASRQLVVVEIQLVQVAQTEKFVGERSRQLVKVQIEENQVGEPSNFCGDGRSEIAALHAPDSQVFEQTNLGWNGANEIVFLCG